jgi:rare lipoprotein A
MALILPLRASNTIPGIAQLPRRIVGAAGLCALALLGGCAQTQQHARRSNGHEYFSSKVYGKASPRMIADGQPVPHGGGQYLVGHPYSIAGRMYYPTENEGYAAVGMASWYGDAFHGRRTANGEIYDKNGLSAAHPTMPLPSYARVTNLNNGASVIVRVNDRGPYHGGRVMDVSSRVADVLDFKGAGTARVKVEYVGRASLDGSDDEKLLATLRTDGSPANLDGFPNARPTMVASVAAPVESLFSALAPAPEPVRPRRPPPQPTPVAAAPPPAPPAADPDAVEAAAEIMRPQPANVPMPPARPFDLGAGPGGPPLPPGLLPPPRPQLHASNAQSALYFGDPIEPSHFDRTGAFIGFRPNGFRAASLVQE